VPRAHQRARGLEGDAPCSVRADLPGVKKEDAKVDVEADGNKGEAWRHVERSSGRFQRRFRLPRGDGGRREARAYSIRS
jgi:HSP20 family molecular chaperone IbpA